jgi:hypothetical protein
MKENNDTMRKFEFLIGDWNLEYKIPKSKLSEAMIGTGVGTFRRALHDKYVYFDYEASLRPAVRAVSSSTIQVEAHAIFAWDAKNGVYRYWWFESSGNFMRATCNFMNDNVLFLSWDDSPMKQTFERINQSRVILRMEHSSSEYDHELILEVVLTRKQSVSK